ncbi:response regulator [Paenibacillus sp. YSY-4.3]
MLRTVIVEDERLSLNMMKRYIDEHPEYELIGAYSDPFEALKDIPRLQVDVLFTDIGMPGLNGLELAERVKQDSMQIVFTTAHREYAADAFRVDAVDYLLKPVTRRAVDAIAAKLERIKRLLAMEALKFKASVMTVKCFGSFRTTNQDGVIVKWPTKKTEEMFAYFIVNEGQILNKWILADSLWPEMDGARAVHNVYNTIYRLKRTFEEFSLPLSIRVINEGYVLEAVDGAISVDLYDYRELSGQEKLTAGQLQLLQNLYAGSLYQDRDYPWCINLRESLEVMHMTKQQDMSLLAGTADMT